MKKILFVLVPLVLMTVTASAQTGILDGQVTVNPPDVFENGGKVYVSFSMDVSGLDVRTDKEVILTPELRDTSGNVEALPEIWLVGRNRYYYRMRNGGVPEDARFYRKKNHQTAGAGDGGSLHIHCKGQKKRLFPNFGRHRR